MGTASLRLEPLEERTLLSLSPALLADIQTGTGASSPTEFVEVEETTFFTAYQGDYGTELWKTDGTVSGTMIVKDIYPGSEFYQGYIDGVWFSGYLAFSSSPQDLTNVDGVLYFTADDGEHGRELWMSDGTEDGTVMVKDIDDGSTYDEQSLTDVPNASDPQELTGVDGTLYFTADDGANGRELWKSDGTEDGTVMVKDIDGGSTDASDPQELTAVGGTLYFTADDGEHGRELWKSDGTGTVTVEDIDDGFTDSVPNSSDPQSLTDVGGTLYFTADDGANGRELWKSDGTGTVMLDDLYPDSLYDPSSQTEVPNSSDPQKLTSVDGTLFFTAYTEEKGRELWTSDGTQGGATLVKDIITDTSTDYTYGEFPNSSSPDGLTDVNGTLFFSAYGEDHGRELWKSDGTGTGTVLVKDVFGGTYTDSYGYDYPNSSDPQNLTNVDGTLYFTADDGTNGRELWKSDGTPDAAEMVKDMYTGSTDSVPNASDPQSLAYANGRLYFSADDGTHGEELWVLPVTAEAIEAEAHLSIFIDGEAVDIPIDVGVDSEGNISTIYTIDAAGTLKISPVDDEPILDPVTLGHFFDTWRTNAGLAGNNGDAVFDEGEILGNTTDADHMIQVFVGGQANRQFDEYGIRDGDEIVIVYTSNEVVSLNTNVGSILIELFPDDTPRTVANFLNYVNDGDYVSSFFHRAAESGEEPNTEEFVLQGGGYKSLYTSFYTLSQFSDVPTDSPVQNEFKLSNVRGTVAMAKLGGQPDSATSQFFVNMKDNTFLDGEDYGKFTVFGQVLNMSLADEIADFDTQNLDPGDSDGDGIDDETLYDVVPFTPSNELVVIQSIGGEGDLSGTSFEDEDRDGDQDAGEAGLAGVTVFVDANDNGVLDDGEVSTFTDSEGDWQLRLPAGTYVIRQEPTGNLYPKTSDGTGIHAVTVEIGGEIGGLDFANVNNAPPVAVDDEYDVDEDTPLKISATAGVLALDTDDEGDDLEAILVSDVEHGTLTLNADGSFTYTPDADFHGADSFTYRAQDEYSQSLTATVEITVNPVNDAPTAVDDGFTLPEGNQSHELDVLDNDTDADGQTLTITHAEQGSEGGTVAITNNGATISYTPVAGFSGTETFDYTIEDPDGLTDEATVTVTVDDEANQTPGSISGYVYWDCNNDGQRDDGEFGVYGVQVTLTGEDDEGDSVSESLLTSADGSYSFEDLAPGTYEVTEQQPAALVDGQDTIGTSGGDDTVDDVFSEIVLSANEHSTENNFGELGLRPEFVSLGMFLASTPPAEDYFPELMAKAEEAAGNTDLADQIRDGIDDVDENDAPSAADDSYSTDEDEALTVDAPGVLANDSDPDGDALTASIQAYASHGGVNLNANGSFVYTPDEDYHGTDSFTYTVSDGSLDSSPATVTITVNSVNDAPEADDDDYSLTSGGSLDVSEADGVLKNDSDAEGETLTASLVTTTPNGTLKLDPEGSFTYTPGDGFHGEDTFIYRAYDGTDYSGETTVTITVNDVPQAAADDYTVDEDVVLTIGEAEGVLDNDTDADGDTLSITVVTYPANGTLTPSADGSFEYKPNLNFYGEDYFTYTASDGYADSNTATVTITVNPVNDAPVANNDDYTAEENVTLDVDSESGVLVNDTDVEGSDLSPVILDHPDHGSVSTFGPTGGSFSYTPDPDFTGTDTFTYTVSDGELESEAATVTITVVAADVPTAIEDEYDAEVGETLTVTVDEGLVANDLNVEDTFDVVVVDDVENGTLDWADDGSFTYTPDDGFAGEDTFTYKLTDGTDESNVATVTITVTGDLPGNDAPVAEDDDYTVTEEAVLDKTEADGILNNDVDVDGSPATPLTSLAITEINYNPSDATDDEKLVDPDFDNNDFEFIELENVSDDTIDLTGVQFTQGIAFDFTDSDVTELEAGETVLVVRNLDAFEARYGTELNVAGEFTGMLSNDGEQIVLEDADGNAIHDFSYDDEGDWPTAADGDGYTLEVDDVTADYNEPTNWAASAEDGGTPGTGTGDTVEVPDVLVITVVDEPTDGELVMHEDGSFVYTPEEGFEGVDTFTYTISDGDQESDLATVTITVEGINDAPVGQDDEYDAVEEQALEVDAADGVLSNDSDDDGSPASALTSLVITEINYHPYDVTEEEQQSDPDLDRDDFEFIELENVGDETIDLTGVQFTQGITFDFTGSELAPGETVLLVADQEAFELRYEAGLNVAGEFGSDQLSNNGETILLVDAAGRTIHEFTYDDSGEWPPEADGEGSTLEVLDVENDYNAPTNWAASAEEGGTPGTGTGLTIDVPDVLTAEVVDQPQNGVLTSFSDDGSFVYTPNADFSGIDTFTYRASDGGAESELITVTIYVESVNDAPEALPDDYEIDEDETLAPDAAGGVLSNDSDVDGSPATPLTSLVITEINYHPYDPTDDELALDSTLTSGDFQFIELENVGHQTIDLAGVELTEGVTFAFSGGEVLQLSPGETLLVVSNGSAFEIRYGDELSVAGQFAGVLSTNGETIRLADAADATIQEFAYDDGGDWPSQADGEGSTLEVLDVTGDYDDPANWAASAEDGGTPGTGTGQTVAVPADLTVVLVAGPTHAATFELNEDGSFTYTPVADYYGPDEFTYMADDGALLSEVTTVTINVRSVNDAPTTGDPQSYEVDEDTLLEVGLAEGLLVNASDVDGSLDTPLTSLVITEIHYHPTDDGSYTSDDFEFIELQNIGDLPIDLTGVQLTLGITFDFSAGAVTELAPDETVLVVANSTAFEARYGTGLNVAGQFTGDLDDDGEQITLKDAAGETILDFTYDDEAPWPTTPDGAGNSLEVIDVTGDYNDAANWAASAESGGTPDDAPASTVDLNKIVVVPGTDPEHGTLTLSDDGSFTYMPEQDFFGTDTFKYRASDGSAKSELITVTITVKPINDAPVADDDNYSTEQDTELVKLVAEGVLANDDDVDNANAAVDELMALLVTGPSQAAEFQLNDDGSFNYTPNAGVTGTDTFTYKVNDGTEDSNEATVTIEITPPGP